MTQQRQQIYVYRLRELEELPHQPALAEALADGWWVAQQTVVPSRTVTENRGYKDSPTTVADVVEWSVVVVLEHETEFEFPAPLGADSDCDGDGD